MPSKQSQRELEEYTRRTVVRLIKEAGTMIRREVVRRHALTAEANIEYAKRLREQIIEDYQSLSMPLEGILREGMDRLQKGEDIGDIIADAIVKGIGTAIMGALARPIEIVVGHINDVNSFVEDVVNKIITELSKEKIYLPKLNTVQLQSVNLPQVIIALKQAVDLMDRSVGILEGLIEVSK